MSKPLITIDVVSDVVCPWCYIGKRRMEKAISQLSSHYDFQVSFHPFELNPDTPKGGYNQKEYLSRKFGGETQYKQITQRVVSAAAQEGLNFDFESQEISPNTRDAHRIIFLAKETGRQPQVKEAFMSAYFEKGIDLSKKENLVNVAVSAGLDKTLVDSWLDSEQGLAEVVMEENINHQRGISGVPFYIINNKYGVSGAQAAETFVKVFTQIGEETMAKGESCDVDKKEC